MNETPTGASVLVVDDTVENLHLLSSILSERGYEVRPVTSGRQAIQAARSYPPEVILLDVNMPEMNGYEVCERLKQIEELREIPVVFLTAASDPADKIRAFAAGGADYITKPFQIDEVVARVKVQVALRQSRVQLLASYERLRTLERLRDDLVQMVVHDMRSPLSALIMLLDYVRRDPMCGLNTQAKADLRSAVEVASSVNRMANDLIDVSRLEEGKLPLDKKTNDVVQICRDVRERMLALDRSRVIDLDVTGVVAVPCDRAIVQRVLENLVSNAIKHTPEGGAISVGAVARAAGVRVSVRDHGPGVPPEARTKIFEKFGAVETRNEDKYHSAGLGLAFCKLAVEAHGGRIGVDPTEPQGSVFWFELPA